MARNRKGLQELMNCYDLTHHVNGQVVIHAARAHKNGRLEKERVTPIEVLHAKLLNCTKK